MKWSVRIKRSAQKELQAIDKPERLRIAETIDELCENPYRGSALKGDLSGLRRLRVGAYRVVYEIRENELIVLVIAVGHRRDVYR